MLLDAGTVFSTGTCTAAIRQALIDAYPPLLKQAGIGGTVTAWALVDPTGAVARTLVARTSGRAELDSAALHVTSKMRFTPARNRAVAVPVWIKLPIVFRTAPDAAPKGSTPARS